MRLIYFRFWKLFWDPLSILFVSKHKNSSKFFFIVRASKACFGPRHCSALKRIGPLRGFPWRSTSHQRSPLQSCFVPGPFEDFPSFYGEETLACFPRCALISPPLKCTHLFFRSLFRPRSMLGYIGDSCRAGFLFSGLKTCAPRVLYPLYNFFICPKRFTPPHFFYGIRVPFVTLTWCSLDSTQDGWPPLTVTSAIRRRTG